MTKKSKKFKNFWVKCYRCDKRIVYAKMQYAVRIPEQDKWSAICKDCYNKRKNHAKPVEDIRKSKHNHMKLERENMLDLP